MNSIFSIKHCVSHHFHSGCTPCLQGRMQSLKYQTRNTRTRLNYVGEAWHRLENTMNLYDIEFQFQIQKEMKRKSVISCNARNMLQHHGTYSRLTSMSRLRSVCGLNHTHHDGAIFWACALCKENKNANWQWKPFKTTLGNYLSLKDPPYLTASASKNKSSDLSKKIDDVSFQRSIRRFQPTRCFA